MAGTRNFRADELPPVLGIVVKGPASLPATGKQLS
jgi:hypothetical protein